MQAMAAMSGMSCWDSGSTTGEGCPAIAASSTGADGVHSGPPRYQFERPMQVHNPGGRYRVLSTKRVVGRAWIDILTWADCRVEVCQRQRILDNATIKQFIGDRCDAVIGQVPEVRRLGFVHVLVAWEGQD